jgi:hypothetical protein
MNSKPQKQIIVIGAPQNDLWLTQLGRTLPASIKLVRGDVPDDLDIPQSGKVVALVVNSSSFTSAEGPVATWRQLLPGCPIVVVASSPTWSHAREAFEAGATDYVSKSLDPGALSLVLQEMAGVIGAGKHASDHVQSQQSRKERKVTPCLAFL